MRSLGTSVVVRRRIFLVLKNDPFSVYVGQDHTEPSATPSAVIIISLFLVATPTLTLCFFCFVFC